MGTKTITLKLLVDTKANKVLFAEASKDFVDFLLFLLSLPVGSVINLLDHKSMVGSIGNVYKSFANLKEDYLQPTVKKSRLLNPSISTTVTNIPLLLNGSSTSVTSPKKFYVCSSIFCRRGITDKYNGAPYPTCSKLMNEEIKYVPSASAINCNIGSGGYVQGIVSYMVSDDLSVTPTSMISSISWMNRFNLSYVQEKEVIIGNEEGLELLKTSFHSTTVLTDVFLGNKAMESNSLDKKVMGSNRSALQYFFLFVGKVLWIIWEKLKRL